MKKLFVFLMSLCLFFSQLTLPEAKEKSSGEGESHYHTVDYEVSESKTKNVRFRSRNVLPKSYDARTENYITSVKNQSPFGGCWAFSAISAAETSALKNGLAADKSEIDLSELQLAYFFYHRVNDPLGNTEGDQNIIVGKNAGQPDGYLQNGGNNWYTAMSLSQWPGPVDESKAPYVNDKNNYPKFLDADLNYLNTEYAMKDAVFLPAQDTEGMKQAIITNGSVSASYASEGMGALDKYFYSGSDKADHAVTIVGYDDSISRELFGDQKPQKDGAWIVKNSWSSRAGDGGYFYLSYDQPLNSVVAYNYMAADQYDNNYFYDGSVGMQRLKTRGGSLTAANVFQAKSGSGKYPEFLEAVSVGIAGADTNYSVQVYTDLKDVSDPYSGTKALAQPVTGFEPYEGIYTIELPDKIKLSQGSHFSVVITLENKSENSGSIFVAKSEAGSWISAEEKTAPQQSFLFDGSGWYDTHASEFCNRIKAFTELNHESLKEQARRITAVQIEKISSAIYNGKKQTPAVIVKDDTAALKEGTDYTLTYSNNINAGQASVTIKGIGNYTGTAARNFTIVPADINKLNYGSTGTKIYNGKPQYPDMRVTNAGIVLKKGTDYTLSYNNNTNAGTAAVTVTGKGNYTGRAVKHFIISRRGVNTLSTGGISNRTYTGRIIKPSVTVKYGSKTLRQNTDYTLSYGKNKNTGKATVKVTGKGNYTGTVTKSFYIVPKKTKITYARSKKSKKLTLKYKKMTGASGYQIAYRKKGTKSYKYKRTSKRSYTLSKLSGKKSYQVKVRAYKTVGKTKYYGSYSPQKTVRIR